MDISSYASNIQSSGTKFADKNGNEAGTPNTANSTGALSLQKVKGTYVDLSTPVVTDTLESHHTMTREAREKLVVQMNEFVASINKGVAFRVDEESGRDVVTIYETESGDVIRQIPDEEMLVVLRRLAKHTADSGLLTEKV